MNKQSQIQLSILIPESELSTFLKLVVISFSFSFFTQTILIY